MILKDQVPGAVIITMGASGSLLVTEEGAEHVPTAEVRAVDPTGAGDAFVGSLAVLMTEGLTLVEAVRRANLAAAMTVTRVGTHDAYPTREEFESFSSRRGG
jgi:ribokinase